MSSWLVGCLNACWFALCTAPFDLHLSHRPPPRHTIHYSPQIRKLYQKATRIIPESLYKAEAQSPALVSIWLGFAAAERYVRCARRAQVV